MQNLLLVNEGDEDVSCSFGGFQSFMEVCKTARGKSSPTWCCVSQCAVLSDETSSSTFMQIR
eukprot:m.32943 g.32943  ORF g.32943 m.32943 type:complete len:62 (+) comp9822_c0_seq2:145-330(+)